MHIRNITIILALLASSASAQVLEVVATTPDLADFARRLLGEDGHVVALTGGHEDPHLVQVRPSMLARISRADLLLQMGADLEHAWLPAILDRAGNAKLKPGEPGFFNASGFVSVRKTESEGKGVHSHPLGNPHFNLDPDAMREVFKALAQRLREIRPESKKSISANEERFLEQLDARMKAWSAKFEPLRGLRLIEYHEEWAYFAAHFELEIIGRIEPRPGAAPTAKHLARLARLGKEKEVKVVIGSERRRKDVEKVAGLVEGKALILQPMSQEGEDGGWLEFLDEVVESFVQAAGKKD